MNNIETQKPETTKPETQKPKNRKPKPKTPDYQSFTAGDRAYTVSPAILADIKKTYPQIFNFLAAEKFDAAREIKLFVSHTVKNSETGKTSRVHTFVFFPGTNKTKKFTKPGQLTFSPAAAIKKYPSLRGLEKLENIILYITINALNSFRFHISYKL